MNIVVRKINNNEYDEALNILFTILKETFTGLVPDTFFDKFNDINFINNYKEALKKYNNYYVVLDDNKIIGMINIENSKSEEYIDYGYLSQIYLLKKYHNKGIGKMMFNKCLEVVKTLGYNNMYLTCVVGNPAIDFYKHLGGNIVNTYEENIDDFKINNYTVVFNNIDKYL